MLLLEVLVPVKRDRAAVATLYDGARKLRQDASCASAQEALAAARGNPQCDPLRPGGHPPLGRYRLLRRAPAPPGSEKEYGAELLVFEAERGPALEAESFGRLGLLVYAGSSGADGGKRRTQGGVRLGKGMLETILERLGPQEELQLRIEALDAPVPWWQFWKRRPPPRTAALSAEPPHFSKPPLDELTILAGLVTSRKRPAVLASDDHDRRDRDSRSSSGSSDGASGGGQFQGGGGGFSGAGASASWGDAPAAGGRTPGVDSAGRILAGAAVGAAAVAVAQAASGQGATEPGEDSSADSSAAQSDSSDTGTTSTGTAY